MPDLPTFTSPLTITCQTIFTGAFTSPVARPRPDLVTAQLYTTQTAQASESAPAILLPETGGSGLEGLVFVVVGLCMLATLARRKVKK